MFTSKTPRDLNHDPEPMISPLSGMRFAVADELLGYEYRPRPEFDHVQHNEPNPILVRFRTWIEGEDLADPHWVDQWIVALHNFDAFGGFVDWNEPSNPFHVLTTASPKQIDHARRVFNLLAVS